MSSTRITDVGHRQQHSVRRQKSIRSLRPVRRHRPKVNGKNPFYTFKGQRNRPCTSTSSSSRAGKEAACFSRPRDCSLFSCCSATHGPCVYLARQTYTAEIPLSFFGDISVNSKASFNQMIAARLKALDTTSLAAGITISDADACHHCGVQLLKGGARGICCKMGNMYCNHCHHYHSVFSTHTVWQRRGYGGIVSEGFPHVQLQVQFRIVERGRS